MYYPLAKRFQLIPITGAKKKYIRRSNKTNRAQNEMEGKIPIPSLRNGLSILVRTNMVYTRKSLSENKSRTRNI